MPEVTITPETKPEDQAHIEAMAKKAEEGVTDPNKQQQQAAPTDGKPDWLGEFDSPEDMAKAYQALRAKMSKEGAPKEEAPKAEAPKPEEASREDAAKAAEAAGVDMGALEAEFTEKGGLSDETYESLAKAGFDRATVDGYIAGQQALADASQARIEAHVGGAETLEAMIEWAASGLSPEEKVAFNKTVDTADEASLLLALDGLKAKYVASEGSEPNLLGGKTTGSPGGVFRSTAELTTAMSDPRYGKDPAYRADVEAKLARSSIF